MKTSVQKLEIVTNIAIILVAIFLSAFIIKSVFFPSTRIEPKNIPVGTKINLSDIDWAKNDRTLLIVLREGCHFCKESAPFYKRLVTETNNYTNLKFVAVLPQTLQESKAYLEELDVKVNDVRQSNLSAIGAAVTPMLILLDNDGKVVKSWMGKLSEQGENEVIQMIKK